MGKVGRELGHDVVALDRDMAADIQTDIMDWDYRTALPPCTEYSRAKSRGIRKIDEANEVVKRTLEIIEYFSPQCYLLENPQTGLLKDQPFMATLPFKDIDYCKYGLSYRKRTRLWGNLPNWVPRPLCKGDCGSMDEGGRRHREQAQRLPSGKRDSLPGDTQRGAVHCAGATHPRDPHKP